MPETIFIGIKPIPDGLVVDKDCLFFALCKDNAIITIVLLSRFISIVMEGKEFVSLVSFVLIIVSTFA